MSHSKNAADGRFFDAYRLIIYESKLFSYSWLKFRNKTARASVLLNQGHKLKSSTWMKYPGMHIQKMYFQHEVKYKLNQTIHLSSTHIITR